jgi:hypothetical protein
VVETLILRSARGRNLDLAERRESRWPHCQNGRRYELLGHCCEGVNQHVGIGERISGYRSGDAGGLEDSLDAVRRSRTVPEGGVKHDGLVFDDALREHRLDVQSGHADQLVAHRSKALQADSLGRQEHQLGQCRGLFGDLCAGCGERGCWLRSAAR